jgi:hypothetical protein
MKEEIIRGGQSSGWRWCRSEDDREDVDDDGDDASSPVTLDCAVAARVAHILFGVHPSRSETAGERNSTKRRR